jgi:hypothetical protein
MKKRVVTCVFTALVFAACLSGCGTAPGTQRPEPGAQSGPPYLWGAYEEQLYAFLNRGNPETQIIILEQDLRTIVTNSKYPPPGLYAQLGLLYAETGNIERAINFFRQEKVFFPEATVFMNFLIMRLEG